MTLREMAAALELTIVSDTAALDGLVTTGVRFLRKQLENIEKSQKERERAREKSVRRLNTPKIVRNRRKSERERARGESRQR